MGNIIQRTPPERPDYPQPAENISTKKDGSVHSTTHSGLNGKSATLHPETSSKFSDYFSGRSIASLLDQAARFFRRLFGIQTQQEKQDAKIKNQVETIKQKLTTPDGNGKTAKSALTELFLGDRDINNILQTACEKADQDTVKAALNDPRYCSANFLEIVTLKKEATEEAPSCFSARFKEGPNIRFSDRDNNNGEMRGAVVKDALTKEYSTLEECLLNCAESYLPEQHKILSGSILQSVADIEGYYKHNSPTENQALLKALDNEEFIEVRGWRLSLGQVARFYLIESKA